jgi:hypothetical protein
LKVLIRNVMILVPVREASPTPIMVAVETVIGL